MSEAIYSPGTLVRARGREWIVLTGSDSETLRLRPLSGSEEDQTRIHLALEPEPVTTARFPAPRAEPMGSHESAQLLRDALLLSLRRGAGPFRSFGQIAVEPRAYQLVPLLMALKLDPVRLLIADDVGIGKTIEAGLIAREFLDRGDIDRMTVLCPPHLVDQWTSELEVHFHLRAVAVTAANARRLEDSLPASDSIFFAHPFTVVSLDYIKSDRRRDEFLRACSNFVIVDEAHTCAAAGPGRHQRYELLRDLTASPDRHLLLLTATPHSGDEDAFFRLLGLLHRDFAQLAGATGDARDSLRERLSRHFVQRRRPDIDEWKENKKLFPKRERKGLTYRLTGAWDSFFQDVLDYCAALVESAGSDERRQRMNFWGTLALMRCVASSPAAAVQALRTHAGLGDESLSDELDERIFDGSDDSLLDDDVEPPVAADNPAVTSLIAQAVALCGQAGDPKLGLLIAHLTELVADGFNPVVFCRYISTAHYVARRLGGKLPGVTVGVITGEISSDERREKVETLGEAEQRVLIATDCLSEGVNLQQHFDAVVHYDLSWNPTRHEQREGRVDRFGQEQPVVRATLIYGENNPVDGAVLEVILKKAKKIRKELGVPVPLPDEGHTLTRALLRAVMLRRGQPGDQQEFDFVSAPEGPRTDSVWEDDADKVRSNRTVFAQRRLKPEEVLPEWRKTLLAVGGQEDVRRFTDRSLARLGSGLEAMKRGFKVLLQSLPEDVRERLEAENLTGTVRVDFAQPPAPRCRRVSRSHPLVAVLAETLLDRSLSAAGDDLAVDSDPAVLGRIGCWVSAAVTTPTTVALLRLRHQLLVHRAGREGSAAPLLVEEATAVAWSGTGPSDLIEGGDALAPLAAAPVGDPPPPVRARFIAQALTQLDARASQLDAFTERRAQALLADHRRVREAAAARGSYAVRALKPADVIGLFVLLPPVI